MGPNETGQFALVVKLRRGAVSQAAVQAMVVALVPPRRRKLLGHLDRLKHFSGQELALEATVVALIQSCLIVNTGRNNIGSRPHVTTQLTKWRLYQLLYRVAAFLSLLPRQAATIKR